MKKVISLLLLLFCAGHLLAQLPSFNGFNYQGIVRDAAGNPLPNKPIGVQFEVFNHTNGSLVYSEAQSTITNSFGLFNLVIGSQNTLTFLYLTPWPSGTDLQVSIDTAGGTNYIPVGPKTQFEGVPYAVLSGASLYDWNRSGSIVAANDFLGSTNAADVVIKTNNAEAMRVTSNQLVGVGTPTPADKMDVSGGINSSLGYRVAGTAPANHFLRSNGTYFIADKIQAGDLPPGSNPWTELVPSVTLVNPGSNVGIGLSPSHKLDVAGAVNISSGSAYKLGGVDMIKSTATTSTHLGMKAGPNNTGANNTFAGYQSGNATTTGTGNTLIGSNAGTLLVSTSNNTAVGSSALGGLTTGNGANTAVGGNAGSSVTTGLNNTFVGYQANTNVAALNGGTAVGLSAQVNNNGATALGTSSLAGGVNSTAIGYTATASGTSATAIGTGASAPNANTIILGTAGDKVGMGTGSPAEKLDVAGGNTVIDANMDYRYRAAKTKYVQINNCSFAPASDKNDQFTLMGDPGQLWVWAKSTVLNNGTQVTFAAPVNLPDGAIITAFDVTFFDNTNNFGNTAEILKAPAGGGPLVVVASSSTSAAQAGGQITPIGNIVNGVNTIDNNNFKYWVRYTAVTYTSNSPQTALYGLKITYTVDKAD